MGQPIQLDRPVFVTGTPRSGKTCISRILAQAPEFHYLDEPIAVWSTGLGLGRRRDDRRIVTEATPEVRERIVKISQQAVEEAGKARYLDNLSYHALRIGFLYAVVPEARIIHVVRDAQSAVPEMYFGWTYRDPLGKAIRRRRGEINLRTLPRQGYRFAKNYLWSRLGRRRASWGPRVPGLEAFAATHSPAEIAAYQWASMIQIARADLQILPSTAWIEIRFEDLLRDPYATTQRIAAFSQVSAPESLAAFAANYMDPNHEFLKRVEPTDQEWVRIDEITRPVREELGYLEPVRTG